ncbi:MAG TPA: SLC13 family permease [Acetobacteraceae bacterium]|nr:SLC13 family permease [Acetobacteraceae bacterium]
MAVQDWATWSIAAVATAGVIVRPFGWPEFAWAVAGAAMLVLLGLLGPGAALAGVARGTDVYLFLTGMMLLSELARQEGLFDWLAARAARASGGSAAQLFSLVFGVGTLVTVFLSNDATAVVLTPAVAAVARAAKARTALPYLYVCAFVANAASFVLPISNPANLVFYERHMPPLLVWLPRYLPASVLAILATWVVLRLTQRRALLAPVSADVPVPLLGTGGRVAAWGIAATAAILLAASALDVRLGLPTFAAGAATACLVFARAEVRPFATLRRISWGVLPLVAGLFVLVQALEATGVTADLALLLDGLVRRSSVLAAWIAGPALAVACNLVNNLPAGLVTARVVQGGAVPEAVRAALLIAVDVGPNLSVTGSLATILWLAALRREGEAVGALTFLRLGVLVMPPALVLAIAAVLLGG